MAKSKGSKPLISGGKTLSKMYSGGKTGSGHKSNKKAAWYQAFDKKFNVPGTLGAWPVGSMPTFIRAQFERLGIKVSDTWNP